MALCANTPCITCSLDERWFTKSLLTHSSLSSSVPGTGVQNNSHRPPGTS